MIAELGLVGAGQVTMATLRTDAAYTDGRHPARVTFSTALEEHDEPDLLFGAVPFTQRHVNAVG